MKNIQMPELKPDQIEYLRKLDEAKYDPEKICQECGAPLGEHVIGGPGPYHPERR